MNSDQPEDSLSDARQGDIVDVATMIVDGEAVETPDGVILISQSCDITQINSRPNVVVAKAVTLPTQEALAAAKGRRPRWVPLTADPDGLHADLEFISSVSKSRVGAQPRREGIARDDWDAQRLFATRVGRRFSRIALPNEVVPWFDRLASKVESAANNPRSPLGRALDLVAEFRVHSKFWTPPSLDLTLFLILEPGELPVLDDAEEADFNAGHGAKTRDLAVVAEALFPETSERPSGAEREALWLEFARAIRNIIKPKTATEDPAVLAAVANVTVQVLGSDDFTLNQVRHTGELDLAHLSAPLPDS